MMDKSTTEARRHGENLNRGIAFVMITDRWKPVRSQPFPRFAGKTWNFEDKIRLFSVSPCLRGSYTADRKEPTRP
jgi:hypothetical protein